jgi:hypothetical protein
VIGGWAIDWLSVLILGALTLLDGVRRIPAGAHLLRRVGSGAWTVTTPDDDARRLLFPWWPSFVLRLIVAPAQPADERADDLAGRLRRVGRLVMVLRLLGAMVLVGVVFGIPIATETWGWRGLLIALLAVEVIAAVVVATAILALRRLGLRGRTALRLGSGLLSPFATPRAAELVLHHAIAGVPPLRAIRQLVPPSAFDAWIRPRAHDLLHAGHAAGDAELEAALPRVELERIIGAPPPHRLPREPWCGRCGRVYRERTSCCADCNALSLTA